MELDALIRALAPSDVAGGAPVEIRDLAHEPLLLWDRQIAPVLYDKILDLYAHADVTPRIVATGGSGPFNHAGIMLVASGKGIYVGYGAPLITNPASGVAVLTVNDPDASIEVCVVHRRGEVVPMVSRFMESVWRVFPQEQRVPAEVA